MRIVSLTCSNTEIVASLGCGKLLVGVDDHTDWPEELVAGLPRVGPDLGIDLDAVEALRPDLVLASLTVPGHETIIEGLEFRGIPHLAPAPETLEDVFGDIQRIGERLGVPHRAARLVAEMREELTPAAPSEAAPRLLVQWWHRPVIAPGPRSWASDVIRAAGGRNALTQDGVKSRPLTDAEVAELDPDALVISWCGVHPDKYRPELLSRNPLWKDLPAIREGRIFCVPEAYLGRPGPRLVEGVRALRQVVASIPAGREAEGRSH